MFNTLIRMIRRANQPTGFQAYLNDVQRRSHGCCGPSFEEARRDYREMVHNTMNLLG